MLKRDLLNEIVNAGISAVAPDGAVFRHLKLNDNILSVDTRKYDLNKYKKIIVLGAGKGAAPMAKALEELLGSRIDKGLIIVKYEHGIELERIELAYGAHPVPDESGLENAWKIVKMAQAATKDDLVICLFTGGASALTPALVEGIELVDLRELTKLLLECGATIHEINSIRKHLSAFSGGRLVQAAYPATVISLIVSDVVGDNLDVIASGPTVPDLSTFKDCKNILEKYNLWEKLPQAILLHLEKGLNQEIAETPKANDEIFENVQNVLIATLKQALCACENYAKTHGYTTEVLFDNMGGEACIEITKLIELAKTYKGTGKKCLLAGGETTVTIRGSGLGGRNQEMALQAGILLKDSPNISVVCVGTDGTDGPTDAAGGFADWQMCKVAEQKNVDLQSYLDNNDSYNALSLSNYILKTGPTRTNVMDIVIILIN